MEKKLNALLQMELYYSFAIVIVALISLTLQTGATRTTQNDAQDFLASQNAARADMRLQPLVWDLKLVKYATWYANQRKNDCELEHSNGPYGENIFWGSGTEWTPAQAAVAWVSERNVYNYWSNSCKHGQDCGHYTQIVWRLTRRIGCARVVCSNGLGVFMTCNYDPPGNYIGERPY